VIFTSECGTEGTKKKKRDERKRRQRNPSPKHEKIEP
jgi:hypothetical protein